MCCSLWGHKELDTTEQLNGTETVRSLRRKSPVSNKGLCVISRSRDLGYTDVHQDRDTLRFVFLKEPCVCSWTVAMAGTAVRKQQSGPSFLFLT